MLENLELIKACRANKDDWYPMIDHAEWIFEKTDPETGDINLGWHAGVIGRNRPFFAECWATEGITMLTIFISTTDLKVRDARELSFLFEATGYYSLREDHHEPVLKTFKDSHGNEFYSLNITVGTDDETYLQGANIIPFHYLNILNRKTANDPEQDVLFIPHFTTKAEAKDRKGLRFILPETLMKKAEPSELISLRSILRGTRTFFQHWGLISKPLEIKIENDPDGDVCWRHSGGSRYTVTLSVESMEYWCQAIYQLGYTLSACIMYSFSPIDAPWIRETICEMMSLFLLKAFKENWQECDLSKADPEYTGAISEYIMAYLTEQWDEYSGCLERCTSYEELCRINEKAAEESWRRVEEVQHLYDMTQAEDLPELFSYASRLFPNTCVMYNDPAADDQISSRPLRYLFELQKRAMKDTYDAMVEKKIY